jgi:8-oxo-dGTP diphosphatase
VNENGGRQTVVGAAIVDSLADPQYVLAARRLRPEALKGRWELPGGKVEEGEVPDVALIREIQEELDVTLMLGHELTPSGKDWPISERFTLRIFLAEIFVGTPKPGESHDKLRWLTADELGSVDWLDADREALAIVKDELSS